MKLVDFIGNSIKNMHTKIVAFVILGLLPMSSNAQEWVTSNHTISTSTSLSVDYAYEQRLANCFSMVLRCGVGTSGVWVINASMNHFSCQGNFTYPAASISIEPRFYTNFGRRENSGKTIYNNSADYITLSMTGGRGIISKSTEISLVPMYGIRRAWGDHVFGELTIGAGAIRFSSSIFFKSHLSVRFGYNF